MKPIYWILLVTAISVAGFSCKGKSQPGPDTAVSGSFQKGILITRVSIKGSDYTYAIYLPSSYDSTKEWPVIFTFDPGGSGHFPVKLCKDEAERRGYILIGSNDSRNGLPYQTSFDIFNTLIGDARSRLSIDPTRIQLMGFSGGARVAGANAMTRRDIRAVIGCSAGLPDLGRALEKPFDYLGVAGMADMNFLEMKMMFDQLDNTPLTHFLLLNSGKHAWPPPEMIPEIFDWLEVKAMKDKLIDKDDDFLTTLVARFHGEMTKAGELGDILMQEYICKKAVHYLEGFAQAEDFTKALSALKANAAYKNALVQRDALLQQEKDAQLQYTGDLYTRGPDWWKKEVARLQKLSKTASTGDEKMMYGRLLGFLSLSTYTLTNQNLRSGAWEAAARNNQIYAIVDPENAEHAYIAAEIAMKLGKEKDALKSLQEAVDLGFKDASRMQNDTSFSSLREKAEFIQLVEKAGKNPPKTN